MSCCDVGRYERKYVVSERMAGEVRRFVAAYTAPDPYMQANVPDGYWVHSVYLDSPRLHLCQQTREGIKNRYKLRVRFYDEEPDSPAFLEIKRRDANTIFKQRARVTKEAAERLLAGGVVGTADLVSPGRNSVRDLAEFCQLQERLGAAGTTVVSYKREAYVLPYAEGSRVTFDRHIAGRLPHPYGRLLLDGQDAPVTSGVVLELKYMGRSPGWMKDLVTSFCLLRVSYPKYVYCVDALRRTSAMAG